MKYWSQIFRLLISTLRNQSARYVIFRIYYEVLRWSGLLILRFPKCYLTTPYSLDKWKASKTRFFVSQQMAWRPEIKDIRALQKRIQMMRDGTFQYFGHYWLYAPDWLTNPVTKHIYPVTQHWSRINTLDAAAGDIKYVWEKSRFHFLYDFIRLDLQLKSDSSAFVFDQMEHWIDQNPVNYGPNWVCSQEIGLRILNWIFALKFYSNSRILTEKLFRKIAGSIYAQARHIEDNLQFSLIALHNNHTLTEALALYTVGILFPEFDRSRKWAATGKRIFTKEVCMQVFEDGGYIQHSMNYHRNVMQLITWALALGEQNADRFDESVYEKARKSLDFLRICQDPVSGQLPNCGNHDGTLFFPLSEAAFNDARPQLYPLAVLLKIDMNYRPGPWQEAAAWFGIAEMEAQRVVKSSVTELGGYPLAGFYVLRETDSLTILRCIAYSSRPFQADNLHLDIWLNGENLLRDAGTYLYNTDIKWKRYFAGTASHNTVLIADSDQMEMGDRFSWRNWVREAGGGIRLNNGVAILEGEFLGYKHLGKPVTHRRKVTKTLGKSVWIVEDWIFGTLANIPKSQLWHPSPAFFKHFKISARDAAGNQISAQEEPGWHSETYGAKTFATALSFRFSGTYIKTTIETN